jgi:hypothetical protein
MTTSVTVSFDEFGELTYCDPPLFKGSKRQWDYLNAPGLGVPRKVVSARAPQGAVSPRSPPGTP